MRKPSGWKLLLSVALPLICRGAAAEDVEPPQAQLLLSIRLWEGAGMQEGVKMLAEPALAVTPGRRFSYVAVGSRPGQEKTDVGTRVAGVVQSREDGSFRLVLRLSVGQEVAQAQDAETHLVRTETFDIRTRLRAGQMKRLNCSRSQECELRLERARP